MASEKRQSADAKISSLFVHSMQPFSAKTRQENLEKLASTRFDVLVIGGGVTGAGVALDAAARGYSVALVEKKDFASGTSSKSTKLVHGGIRYLPNFDFALVREGLIERGLLLQNAPFLVQPLAFVLPIYQGDRHPVGMPFTTPGGIGLNRLLDMGLWIYDGMAGKYGIQHHRHISREQVLQYAPDLVSTRLKEGFIYYDAQTNDARLTMTLMRTAAQHGVTIANYAEVTSFLQTKGQLYGAQVHDHLGGAEIDIQARHIVNATGVFSEQVETLTGRTTPSFQIEPSKGVHLVLSREDIKLSDAALVLPETEDKRILFLVPWESRLIFGTTDTGTGDLDHPTASHEDIAYLLKYLNRYLGLNLTAEQIVSTYVGYRPLFKSHAQAHRSTARLSRTHAVIPDPSGLVTIVGGKLTTYRRMAQDTVDLLNRRDKIQPGHPTLHLSLQGSSGWQSTRTELEEQGKKLGLSKESVQHLASSYGSEARQILELIDNNPRLGERLIADLPYIRAEIVAACRYEMAMSLEDILARRTSIALEDRQRGLSIIDEVAACMAQEHQWTRERQERESQAYRGNTERQLLAEKAASVV